MTTHQATAAPTSAEQQQLTIIGFGSLLSERSSRMTFPDLQNFRLGRVPSYRRVFGHVTGPFFQNGIAKPETMEMASLSAEYVDGDYHGFICTIFEVPNHGMMEDTGVPSAAFLAREEEFDIVPNVTYVNLDGGRREQTKGKGILCARGSDDLFLQRWGKDYFEERYGRYGMMTIWNWKGDSGLRPCPTYLRHCTLAAKAMGNECYNSFLDETFLVDRKTTIRSYLETNPHVMEAKPPAGFEDRWGG